VQESFPNVLKGMKYFGIPNGRMIDALLDNGGSCEQLSHLSVSLLNDLGYRKHAFLRIYGANDEGVGHLAPILKEKGKEYDIVAGKISDGKGTIFPASYLVEAYAGSHGLPFEDFKDKSAPEKQAPKKNIARSAQELSLPDGKPSGASYPKAKDSYPGGVPLFAERAFMPFSEKKSGPPKQSSSGTTKSNHENDESGNMPQPYQFLGVRSVASAALFKEDDRSAFPVVEMPKEERLSQLSSLIEIEKKDLKSKLNDAGLALKYATICGLYRELEWNLRIFGMDKLADAAFAQRKKIANHAKKPLANLLEDNGPWDPSFSRHELGYLVYLGKEGEKVLVKEILKFTKGHWKGEVGTDFYYHGAAFLIAGGSDGGKILEILDKFDSEQRMVVLKTLDGLEFDGKEEAYRAFRVNAAITRQFSPGTGEKRMIMRGVLHQGESLMKDDLRIRLDEVAGKIAKLKAVIISIVNSEKTILRREKIREGQVKSQHFNGRSPFVIRIDKVAPAYTFSANWADISILSSGTDTFEELVALIKKECRENRIGQVWEDAIIAAQSKRWVDAYLSSYGKMEHDPNFFKSFYSWLSRKTDFEITRKRVEGMYPYYDPFSQ